MVCAEGTLYSEEGRPGEEERGRESDWVGFHMQTSETRAQVRGGGCARGRGWMVWMAAVLASGIALGMVGAVSAQSPKQELSPYQIRIMRERAAADELAKEELVTLHKETARAVQHGNPSFFLRVYSDDFVGTLPSGQVVDKAGYMKEIGRSEVKYTSVVVTDVRVRLYDTTAVVTSLWSERGNAGDRAISRQARFTVVYVTDGLGWKAVASQETVLPG